MSLNDYVTKQAIMAVSAVSKRYLEFKLQKAIKAQIENPSEENNNAVLYSCLTFIIKNRIGDDAVKAQNFIDRLNASIETEAFVNDAINILNKS